MFGFWRDLLERGGSRGAGPLRTQANYDDIWRQGLYRAFPGGRLEARAAGEQWTRTWTLDVVKEVHALRNRAAHHASRLSYGSWCNNISSVQTTPDSYARANAAAQPSDRPHSAALRPAQAGECSLSRASTDPPGKTC